MLRIYENAAIFQCEERKMYRRILVKKRKELVFCEFGPQKYPNSVINTNIAPIYVKKFPRIFVHFI